ncbi:polysaccharide deacetylase family sporulation protein PdaB [Aquibacillus sp. 3ASR75-11]|uniref:Polysaccharide deacetylase family sporulation protein PdaB n=1 Tax=Terrihalobacillus insolitus TaxID=2950438 RepID=A0A9X4APH3_9BACI|nr:polysaccharide deacetylase family sporulation protein PdaB [Terrihalobacillus insolitus]MDC3414602.1 polysaccharide deacetylase family sporulation protein PdaB [Terrihalobacillus insolitus]MDC3425558.1 polysaccharide deacetylase family sporulation protein PdaB [Terrihalobacillus insolitus]
MQHFYVWKFKNWKRWMLILIAAMFSAVFLWVQGETTFSVFSSKESPAALSKGSDKDPNIALTFNISWGNTQVEPILDQLKKQDVKATFFVNGEWAERHPELVDKIKKNGHEIGMLGYRYESYLKQDIEDVRKDLLKAKEVFRKLGYDTRLLRTPSGHFNKEVLKMAESMGFKVIHWNVNPQDWKNPGTQTIIDYVMKNTTKGDILLLHASDSVKQTPKALETILPGLKNKGFKFVPMSELISRAEAQEKKLE